MLFTILLFVFVPQYFSSTTASSPDHQQEPLETQKSLFLPLSMEDNGHGAQREQTLWGGRAAEEGQQGRGEQEVRGNIIMINRFLFRAPISSSLGCLSTLSCPESLHIKLSKKDGRQQKSACMCVCARISNLLAHWFADVCEAACSSEH